MPDGCYRQVVYSPAIGEQRAFELPVSVLARYLHTLHLSGCTSHSMTLTHTREYPPGALGSIPPPPASQRPPSSVLGAAGQPNATTTHFVQVNRARMLAGYENGWSVLHTGTLRAGLTTVPSSSTTMLGSSSGSGGVDLKFQFIDFHIREHESLVSKNRIQRGGVEQVIPEELVNKIRGKTSGNKAETKKEQRDREKREASNAAGGGGGGGDQDDKSGIVKNGSCTDEEKYTLPIERLTLPDNPINEYGMTLRSMRCLEVSTDTSKGSKNRRFEHQADKPLLPAALSSDHRVRLSIARPHGIFCHPQARSHASSQTSSRRFQNQSSCCNYNYYSRRGAVCFS